MTIESILNLILSIITVLTAEIALFQTRKQIKLSNQQQLFDRGLDKYLLFKEMLSLYSQHRSLIADNPNIYKVVDFPFNQLTNCSTLESMCSIIKSPLNQEFQKVS